MKSRLSAQFVASVSMKTTMTTGEGVAVSGVVVEDPRARSRDECVMQVVITVGSLCEGESIPLALCSRGKVAGPGGIVLT